MTDAVPTESPVTIPEEFTVAVASPVLQVPPGDASLRLHEPPTHIGVRPEIGRMVFTVTINVAPHPVVPVE